MTRSGHPPPVQIAARSVVTAAGIGTGPLRQALREQRSALVLNRVSSRPLATFVGEVAGVGEVRLPPALLPLDCRNNRLAALALEADDFGAVMRRAAARFGAHRIGVAIGTSTSSIGATEAAYRRLDAQGRVPPASREPRVHTMHSPGIFVQAALGLTGPAITVSTACSSSAKVFGVAQRWLGLGIVDAVLVGGVDSLCDSVLFGFNSLQLVSPERCRPFDAARRGINLGEAAGFALLTCDDGFAATGVALTGVGESSDAHHMSAPHPQGLGARRALEQALAQARLAPADIDYLNLHGTATERNDAVEAELVARMFGDSLHASSTKGCVGHTLGAAGIVEAVICMMALETGQRPGTVGTTGLDPVCGPQIRLQPSVAPVRHAASHSFGFGGSNCVLVLSESR
ncbi:MAG TPA: beta-ketoacyl-ACP synthase [Burkholderiaceae bacterium]|nr:beta-ketoacyl-ACP synthase [Burkholderiaceae bacterium]